MQMNANKWQRNYNNARDFFAALFISLVEEIVMTFELELI